MTVTEIAERIGHTGVAAWLAYRDALAAAHGSYGGAHRALCPVTSPHGCAVETRMDGRDLVRRTGSRVLGPEPRYYGVGGDAA